MAGKTGNKAETRYIQIMRELFRRHYGPGVEEFEWAKKELNAIASDLGIVVPQNVPDNIYSIRHGRSELPDEIKNLAPSGKKWLLLPNGKGQYRFALANNFKLEHNSYLKSIKVPDSTPQIVADNALGDEQAILARLRYNRLIDLFFGLAAYPLQSHLRTTVEAFNKSQIETDEIYVGVDRHGAQYILPVQAKSLKEDVGAVQIIQDYYGCKEKFPGLECRPIAAKTIDIEQAGKRGANAVYTIALMELDVEDNYDTSIVDERHYKLVASGDISSSEMQEYRKRAQQSTS